MSYIYHKEVLQKVVVENNIEIMAEIGVWKTHMPRRLLRDENCFKVLKEYWAIDQWKVLSSAHGHMSNRTTQDWNGLYFNACKYMPWFKQLRVLRLTSLEASKIFVDGYFDFIYIDASHFYEDVLDDIKVWLPKVKKGGIFGGHDYGMGGRKNHGVKKAIDEYFGEGNVELDSDGVWLKRI